MKTIFSLQKNSLRGLKLLFTFPIIFFSYFVLRTPLTIIYRRRFFVKVVDLKITIAGAVTELAAAIAKAEEAEAENWLGFLGFFLSEGPGKAAAFF